MEAELSSSQSCLNPELGFQEAGLCNGVQTNYIVDLVCCVLLLIFHLITI